MWLHRWVRGLRPWVVALWAASLILPAAVLFAQALEATFADLKGEVQYSAAGSTQYERADSNTVLHAGDRVRTLANSSARLSFYEGSTTDLAAFTGIRIDDLSTSNGQASIQLLQSEGITQAQVQQAPDRTTAYRVESPASVAAAPPTTCPWVRVSPDGATLVRNYTAGAQARVAPQPVQELTWVPGLVPGIVGPVPQLVPQLAVTLKEMPVPLTPDEQPLFQCPHGVRTAAVQSPDVSAELAGAEAGSYHLASADSALAPLLGRVRAAGALASVEAQAGSRDITVRNTSGQVQTVAIPPGQESLIRVGQPPTAAAPIGTLAAQAAAQAASAAAQQQAAAAAAGAQAQAATASLTQAQALAGQNAFNNQVQRFMSEVQRGAQQPPPVQPTPQPTTVATMIPNVTGIQGVVRNAVTGQGLAGATVSAGGVTTTTDASGNYRLTGLAPGTITVTATASGFISNTGTVFAIVNQTATLPLFLSPVLPAGQVRILLTWGATPVDLDAHLWVPTTPSTTEVFFANLGSTTATPFASLDMDARCGFGPETVTITQVLPGQYTYAVDNFVLDAPLAGSGARVQVFSGSSLLQTFTAPTTGSGEWWTVFTMNGTTITPVNTLSNTPPLPSGTPPVGQRARIC